MILSIQSRRHLLGFPMEYSIPGRRANGDVAARHCVVWRTNSLPVFVFEHSTIQLRTSNGTTHLRSALMDTAFYGFKRILLAPRFSRFSKFSRHQTY